MKHSNFVLLVHSHKFIEVDLFSSISLSALLIIWYWYDLIGQDEMTHMILCYFPPIALGVYLILVAFEEGPAEK